MDYKILSSDPQYGTYQYLVDEDTDIEKLPKGQIGSFVLVAATSDVYVLNNKREWVKL